VNWDKNIAIEKASGDSTGLSTILRSQWGYGDDEAKTQLESILAEDTLLLTGYGEREGQTVRDDDDRRIVYLKNYQSGMTTGELLTLGTVLQHEAHRDGYEPGKLDANGVPVTKESNTLETRAAVLAHTKMAERMLLDGQDLDLSKNLGLDLAMYEYAKSVDDMTIMDAYADNFYRSDRDYFDPINDTITAATNMARAMLSDDGSDNIFMYGVSASATVFPSSGSAEGGIYIDPIQR
jgi:hypothetical protein